MTPRWVVLLWATVIGASVLQVAEWCEPGSTKRVEAAEIAAPVTTSASNNGGTGGYLTLSTEQGLSAHVPVCSGCMTTLGDWANYPRLDLYGKLGQGTDSVAHLPAIINMPTTDGACWTIDGSRVEWGDGGRVRLDPGPGFYMSAQKPTAHVCYSSGRLFGAHL